MKKFGIILLLVLTVFGVAGYTFYNYVTGPNILLSKDKGILTIPPGSTYKSVRDSLTSKSWLKNDKSFDLVAGLMKYKKDQVPSGKYLLKNNMSNRSLIGILRAGDQMPINVTFNNMVTFNDLAGQLSKYFYVDSIALLKEMVSEGFLAKNNVNKENILTLFVPNTYQMYWDDEADKIIDRLVNEQERFWQKENRRKKAEKLGMHPTEVYTLASVVEKESNYKPERKTIAGLYLNRIKKGIPLQADPTVKYAVGELDLRRVLNKHLEYDSPYNTYKYAGLPPGPIYMPSVNSIDAVLNAEKHQYLYMCAKPGYNSEHVFANSLRQHQVNANRYHRWLNSEGIR